MTTRLPVPGSDDGGWGDILNAFLEVGHSATGINEGPVVETAEASNFTLASANNGTRIVATGAITITVPAVGTLGNGFECEVVNDSGGTVTIQGPISSVTVSNGYVACILEVNGKQRVSTGSSAQIS